MYRTIFLILFLYGVSITIHAEDKIVFPNACQKGETLVIAAVGDILLHYPLQVIGSQKSFASLWQAALPILQSADIAYANLEGPINAKSEIGTGFPLFSYPKTLAPALKNSGFSIVSTANNHALDQGSQGIDNTIKVLDSEGIAYTGTRLRDSTNSWVHIMLKSNFKIAWIACTAHTNGIPDPYQQILHCYNKTDRQWIMQTIHNLKSKVDIIIVLPHWGEQYQYLPNHEQIEFAHEALNAGASAVLGSHPHVLQSAEKYLTHDGRATFVMYSLGNFVSFQGTPTNRTSIILLLRFTKTNLGTQIDSMRFVPIYMQNRNGSEDMKLIRLQANSNNRLAQQIIDRVLPLGNVAYGDDSKKNLECE